MMIRNKLAGAAVGALVLGGVTAPSAWAQEDDAPLDNPVTEDTNADDDGGFDDWGLLGLLGLLGLAGLAGKKRNDEILVRRDTTPGSGSTTTR